MKTRSRWAGRAAAQMGLLAVLVFGFVPNCRAQKYGSLSPGSLACTRDSISLGDAALPACEEDKSEYLDSVTYYASFLCIGCDADTVIPLPPLGLNIGQKNGPCTYAVSWSYIAQISPITPPPSPNAFAESELVAVSGLNNSRSQQDSQNDCNGDGYQTNNGVEFSC